MNHNLFGCGFGFPRTVDGFLHHFGFVERYLILVLRFAVEMKSNIYNDGFLSINTFFISHSIIVLRGICMNIDKVNKKASF
jgi:hypothetical protein